MKIILFVFGTRPEAIKMAPLIKQIQLHPTLYKCKICLTAQHREMLDQVLTFFKICPDYDLNLMRPNQTLFDITSDGLKALENVMDDCKPDLIFVQGDTTTAFIGALAGYYMKIKVAHIEAGLRSGDMFSPFPEEGNRSLIGKLSNYHFAPTQNAEENLLKEGIINNIYVVGNTVIDALLLGLDIITDNEAHYLSFFRFIDFTKRIILVTGHRRESFGQPFEDICQAIKYLADKYEDIEIIFPVHLNPNVQEPVNRILKDHPRIHLTAPLDYPYLLWIMYKSYLILTDSGGIQEEAPTLGKPVLVMRELTERTEGIEAGTAILVGTDKENIIRETELLLTDNLKYQSMANAVNPYGDGTTARKILSII